MPTLPEHGLNSGFHGDANNKVLIALLCQLKVKPYKEEIIPFR